MGAGKHCLTLNSLSFLQTTSQKKFFFFFVVPGVGGVNFPLTGGAHLGLFFFVVFLKFIFIYLFLAVLGLRFCARAFSSCGEQGPLFIAVRRPLTIVASLCRAQAPDAQAQ